MFFFLVYVPLNHLNELYMCKESKQIDEYPLRTDELTGGGRGDEIAYAGRQDLNLVRETPERRPELLLHVGQLAKTTSASDQLARTNVVRSLKPVMLHCNFISVMGVPYLLLDLFTKVKTADWKKDYCSPICTQKVIKRDRLLRLILIQLTCSTHPSVNVIQCMRFDQTFKAVIVSLKIK